MVTSNNSPLAGAGCIFLVGFMGSGKSYWGNIWSRQNNLPFFDLDEIIETQQQKTIAQIFEQSGEPHFRILETATLQNFSASQNCIVACGGGTPCFNNNMQWMNDNGLTIYLKATPDEIVERIKYELEKRPLLKTLSEQELFAFIEKKIEEREEFYLQAKKILPVKILSEKLLKHSLYKI